MTTWEVLWFALWVDILLLLFGLMLFVMGRSLWRQIREAWRDIQAVRQEFSVPEKRAEEKEDESAQ